MKDSRQLPKWIGYFSYWDVHHCDAGRYLLSFADFQFCQNGDIHGDRNLLQSTYEQWPKPPFSHCFLGMKYDTPEV